MKKILISVIFIILIILFSWLFYSDYKNEKFESVGLDKLFNDFPGFPKESGEEVRGKISNPYMTNYNKSENGIMSTYIKEIDENFYVVMLTSEWTEEPSRSTVMFFEVKNDN